MAEPMNGGPAYPAPAQVAGNGWGQDGNRPAAPSTQGMSLRDWFAGQAMAAIEIRHASEAAEFAYVVADAMLAARVKR